MDVAAERMQVLPLSMPYRMLLKVSILLAAGYIGFAALVFLLQDRLLFLPGIPGRELVTTPAAHGLPFEDVWLTTEDGETLHGWWIPAPGDGRRSVLIFHGNAGNISHRIDTLRIWHNLGFHAFIFDYRGYGASSGRPSEAGTYVDARAAWRHLVDDRGQTPGSVVLFGRSLGAAVAAELARHVDPAALIMESTFTSVPDLATELYWWLPVRWLARLRYDTVAHLADVSCPVLVVHSTDDEIIPFHHGEAIFAAANEPKQMLQLAGDHNTGFIRYRDRYVTSLVTFLEAIAITR